jgi:hypothetical protein
MPHKSFAIGQRGYSALGGAHKQRFSTMEIDAAVTLDTSARMASKTSQTDLSEPSAKTGKTT